MFLTVESKPSSNFENHVSHNVVENGLETQITLQSKTLTLSMTKNGDGAEYNLGHLRQPWSNNVVQLGNAYGLLPIMGAPLRL